MSEQKTCAWAMNHPLEREYHDAEWGKPVYVTPYSLSSLR